MSDNPTIEDELFGNLTPPALSVSEEPEPAPEQDELYEKLLAEHETLKGRYEESGKEGKRRATEAKELKEQLEQVSSKLEEVKPFLTALEKDPRFVSHISSYYEGPNVRDELGDDFSDYSAADLLDSESKIGKIFSNRMDQQVEQRARAIVQAEFSTRDKMNEEQSRKDAMNREVQAFLKNNPDKDESYVEELLDYAGKMTLSLENIDKLKNLSNTTRNVDHAAREDIRNQMRNVGRMPSSLASNTSTAAPNPLDEMFEQMKKQTGSQLLPPA